MRTFSLQDGRQIRGNGNALWRTAEELAAGMSTIGERTAGEMGSGGDLQIRRLPTRKVVAEQSHARGGES